MNEAVELLSDYNGRLLKEMEDRKSVTKMLHEFTAAQKELLVQAEERLQVGNIMICVVLMWKPRYWLSFQPKTASMLGA